jgi:tetratricopeptide (TPR) repeat protein
MRDMLEQALQVRQNEFGQDHPAIASTLNNLGSAYGELGDWSRMRNLLERALQIQERAYGRDHVENTTMMTNLGRACGNLGDWRRMCD